MISGWLADCWITIFKLTGGLEAHNWESPRDKPLNAHQLKPWYGHGGNSRLPTGLKGLMLAACGFVACPRDLPSYALLR
jgi:hypothetical protein